jgi:hypothetical protein
MESQTMNHNSSSARSTRWKLRVAVWIGLPAAAAVIFANFGWLSLLLLLGRLLWYVVRIAYFLLLGALSIRSQAGEIRHQAAMIGMCLASIVITQCLTFVWFPLLRYRMNPVLSKIETFREEKGRYPEEIGELVPGYLTSIPDCFPPGLPTPVHYYYRKEDVSFYLGCPLVGFGKAAFTPGTGWYLWD